MRCEIWLSVIFVPLLLASTGTCGEQDIKVAYSAPKATPYRAKPRLEEQYLKAHKAAWQFVILSYSVEKLEEAIKDELSLIWASHHRTCCEATRNVTLGWYQGQDGAGQFLKALAIAGKSDPTIVEKYRILLKDLKKNPVKNWYVLDGYNPKKLVTETERAGETRIERTYRDKKKKTLVCIKKYRGDVLEGNSEQYDANGALWKITPYKNGLIDGTELSFSDSGVILGKEPYVQGKKHGVELWYGETGELTIYMEWVNGEQHGKEIVFQGDADFYRYFNWKHGKKDGLCIYYTNNGELTARSGAEYKNGVEVRKIAPLTPTSKLPKEYQPAALVQFRMEHRRGDDQDCRTKKGPEAAK